MAFDRPLEADRVDDLNLFSAFVRVPIVGGLMWLVAGGGEQKEKQKEKEEQRRDVKKSLMGESDNDGSDPIRTSDPACDGQLASKSTSKLRRSGPLDVKLKQVMDETSSVPKLVGSELSVTSRGWGESAELKTNEEKQEPTKLKKKKMSWSDSLVEYMDESTKHEPTATSKPAKSAITRTSSMRDNAAALQDYPREDKIRYLPKGMDRSHSGIIMPTRPLGHASSGVDSPQWGWYINTTPPTPEMYHTRSSLAMHEKKASDSSAASMAYTANMSIAEVSMERAAASRPNRVFQGLKDANKPVIGWPSVPL